MIRKLINFFKRRFKKKTTVIGSVPPKHPNCRCTIHPFDWDD